MKKLLYAALIPLSLLAASCGEDDKKNTTVTPEPKRWVKVYKNVVIADDRYPSQGQFLNTKTGTVVKVADATDAVREQLALTCYITESGSYVFLTAPGSLAGALGSPTTRPIFTQNPNGLNNWSPNELNTSQTYPANSRMTATEFDNVANAGTWTAFNEAFVHVNGNENLGSTLSYQFAQSGDIFLIQINGALRMIVKANTVSDAITNGYIKADVIVEGREDMAEAGKAMMPAE